MTRQTAKYFSTAQAAREYLAQFGFAPFKKGLTSATLTSPAGRVAFLGFVLTSKTGQSSIGSAANWQYSVTVKGAGA